MNQHLKSSKAALDLTSIMVGVVVIGILGAVISATVFAVIPWAQDNAAKSSLMSVATAQEAYAGDSLEDKVGLGTGSLVEAATTPTPDTVEGLYTDLETLVTEGLIESTDTLCAQPDDNAAGWNAAVVSATGRSFYPSGHLTLGLR